ncbi:dihydrodipicolinate synthase family protein [Entomobacter blattae]|uniref:dihydrodipicolinate synthase family protein n=1 Tax=Entomobacter blattae TaxID=2762277 RepID=UPI00308439F9
MFFILLQEHRDVVEIAVKVASGRIPIIAETGSNSTAEANDSPQQFQISQPPQIF